MSLDIYLTVKKWVSYDECKTHEKQEEMVYEGNITHNLNNMAKAAFIYDALWRPEEIKVEKASGLIDILEKGLADLKEKPCYFKQFDTLNGWGVYEHFVPFVERYLEACKKYPTSKIEVSR